MLLFIVVLLLLSYLFYVKCIKSLYYWDERGIPNVRGWPIFGKQAAVFFRRISPTDWLKLAYEEFPDKRYNGNHQFNRPVMILRDPDLIKQVTVKNADHFVNRIDIISKEMDPFLGNSLLFLHDQEWKNMRSTLSPAFTSSKMKAMFNLIVECAEGFNNYFDRNGVKRFNVDMKDLTSRFTNDVIASCAFGVKCNSLENKNNEFYQMGKNIVNFGPIRMLKFFGYSIIPKVMQLLDITVFPKKVNLYFKNILLKNIEHREENKVVRPDMLHLLIEAKNGKLKSEEAKNNDTGFATVEEHLSSRGAINITNDDIVSQGLVFFFAGFEPSSTIMSFIAHELALNPDVQEKLIAEIDQIEKVNYETVLGLKYLDMVVSETLRKWPTVPVIHRKCNKEFFIPAERPDEKDLLVEKGQMFIMPTFGIHYDEKYYPNPEKFDPERFSDENKHLIKPYTYFPFGLGPRNCIGSRFALLEIKTFFAVFLSKYKIVATDRTSTSGKLTASQLNLTPVGGFWVGIVERKDKKN